MRAFLLFLVAMTAASCASRKPTVATAPKTLTDPKSVIAQLLDGPFASIQAYCDHLRGTPEEGCTVDCTPGRSCMGSPNHVAQGVYEAWIFSVTSRCDGLPPREDGYLAIKAGGQWYVRGAATCSFQRGPSHGVERAAVDELTYQHGLGGSTPELVLRYSEWEGQTDSRPAPDGRNRLDTHLTRRTTWVLRCGIGASSRPSCLPTLRTSWTGWTKPGQEPHQRGEVRLDRRADGTLVVSGSRNPLDDETEGLYSDEEWSALLGVRRVVFP